MIYSWLINIAIGFIIRQIAKFNETLDWSKVAADLDTRIRALIPGDMFDSYAVSLIEAVLSGARSVLSNEAVLTVIATKIAVADWDGAIASLKDLLTNVWDAQTPAELHVKKILVA